MKKQLMYIGGQEWTIYFVGERSKFLRQNGKPTDGMCYFDKCRIYVCVDNDPQAVEDTLLHEWFHAVMFVSGGSNAVKVACGDDDIANKLEETLVAGMTPIFHRLLKDQGFVFPT
jgi:hypothetical protein